MRSFSVICLLAAFAKALPTSTREQPSLSLPNGYARTTPEPALTKVNGGPKPLPPGQLKKFLPNGGPGNNGKGPGGQNLAPRAHEAAPLHIRQSIASTCIDSTGNDTLITSLFYYGGAGTTVNLCPGAKINLTNAIFFTAANQTLTTLGMPTDNTRATLTVTAQNQSCAVFGLWANFMHGTTLRNVIIDGARQTLGRISNGIALIEMGGNSFNQQVLYVKASEPRGWSALHSIEGYKNYCSSMNIANNDIGPAGHSPNGAQFRRDLDANYGPGQWADGISHACKSSTVTGNTITDATDGGIVIFGAPGSTISNNKIVTANRQLLGGINLVDWSPFNGSFIGTTVQGNTLTAQGAMMKIGIAMGPMVWGVDNRTIARTYGGSILSNTFTTSGSGYFGYSIATAGVENATISGNSAVGSTFAGSMSGSCFGQYPLPMAQPFIFDPSNTPGCSTNAHTNAATIVFAICAAPGPVWISSSPY